MRRRHACITLFGIFLLLVSANCSELGDRCETPDRVSGKCIRVKNCPPLVTLLQAKPVPPATLDLLRKSHCGSMRTEPLVCCPSTTLSPLSSRPLQSTVKEVTEDVSQHANLRLLRPDICGRISEDKIINGNRAQLNELPWMALVFYSAENERRFGCGGSLISDRYILTAAHCLKFLPKNVYPVSVRLGENDMESDIDCEEDPEGGPGQKFCAPAPQDIEIEKTIPHPKYAGKPNIHHDVALIRLSRPADFTSGFIRPICLPTGLEQQNYDLFGVKAVVAGWGVTESGMKSPVLLKATVPVMAHEQCANAYQGIVPISAVSQVCAGGVKNKGDTCSGDSGGPLLFFGNVLGTTRAKQYGVVSFGPKECDIEGQPAVYSRVGHYMKWILDNMKE